MSFGSYLKQKREAAGWTTNEIAERMGITQSYVSQLETGFRFPSQKTLTKLAKAYELPEEEVREHWTQGKIQSVSMTTDYKFDVKEVGQRVPVLDSILPIDDLDARVKESTKFYLLPKDSNAPAKHRLFGFKANGLKLMDAGILPGDFVIIDPDAAPKDSDIVVVSTPDGVVMTYFHKRGDFLELRPAPEEFKKTYSLKESKVVGRLVYHIKKY